MRKFIFKISVILLFVTGSNFSQAQVWTKMANFPGVVRYLSSSFTIGHYGYVGGGSNGGSAYYKDFYRWNQNTNTWSVIASYPGAGPMAPISFAIEGKGYVGTGEGTGGVANDFWSYDTTTNTWTAMANFPGPSRYDASAFVVGHKAYLIAGSTGGPPYLNDVWMYDAHTNTWTQLNNSPTGEVEAVVAYTIGNHGYIGMGWNGGSFLNSCWQYDTANDTWISITNFPLAASNEPEAFVIGNKSYVCVGGNNSGPLKDGYVYDTVTKTWSTFTNMGANKIERRWAVAFSIGNDGYIANGVDSLGDYLNDFWQYAPITTAGINTANSIYSDILVYPNPNNGVIHLIYDGSLNQNAEFIINDITGRTVLSKKISSPQPENIVIDASKLAEGMYFYQVVSFDKKLLSTGKIIIAL